MTTKERMSQQLRDIHLAIMQVIATEKLSGEAKHKLGEIAAQAFKLNSDLAKVPESSRSLVKRFWGVLSELAKLMLSAMYKC
jgi:hypothetical protein